MTDWVAELCTHMGVHARYRGFDGQIIEVSRDTQSAVLGAMGVDVGSDPEAQSVLKHMQSEDAARPLPPEVIVKAGRSTEMTLAHSADWLIEAEGTGETLASGQGGKTLSLPPLPMGIHRLRLTTAGTDHITWLLARPERAIRLEDQLKHARIWGVTAALYGLTDGDTAQIGGYDMLGEYAAATAGHGADFFGINPVHAMGQVRPENVISPYSPSHRAFLNTWHCAFSGRGAGNHAELIEYPTALKSNEIALAEQYAAFNALPEDAREKHAFRIYAAQGGAPLHEFALFETLSARLGADWRTWPAQYRDHEPDALADFAAKHGQDVTRIKWAQWQAEQQLDAAQTKAQAGGMRIGLYLDLAVGPRLGGAETWDRDTALVTGATLGAPPDPLGPTGQSWGLAPLSPHKCRATGYAGFARLLRSIMRYAGMIRIDHVLGLMRSFWIPEGGTEGTYVSYPFEALLAVVAIESVRNNTIVVGEDLGLVPEGLRDELGASGIYGLDVLQYMRTSTGGFVDPSDTRELAVCAFATHDTPTVAGFFAAEDARVRHAIGDIDANTLDKTRADRMRAEDTLSTCDPVAHIHRSLARTNASVVAIQLDDIAARTSQQNLPGTVDSYQNWRLKAPFTLSEIGTSPAFAQLTKDMAAQGRSNPKGMEKENDLSDYSDKAC